jgi:hypothetical protein
MFRIPQAFICFVLGFALCGLVPAQTIQINRENKTIAISAKDEAVATADIAAITIGFEVFGADSQGTYTDGGKLSRAILEALHKVGVKDESVESTQQSIERNTEFTDKDTPQDRAKRQFVFQQSWEVSVSPQIAAAVIRVAVIAGANKSGEIDWRLADRKALQAKAAENALVKARVVASNMADGLHVKLGALIYASNETPTAHFYANAGLGVASAEVTVNASSMPPPPPPPLEIHPKTIREEATVYAVFSIE